MSTNTTVFLALLQAVQATLSGLPEVAGRIYTNADAAVRAENQPAIVLELGDDSSDRIDEITADVRVELVIGILTDADSPAAAADPIELAVMRRLADNPTLDGLLDRGLTRTQGVRRVLRQTEGTPALRQLRFACRTYANAADMTALQP